VESFLLDSHQEIGRSVVSLPLLALTLLILSPE